MLLREPSTMRRVALGVWGLAVGEFSVTAGWLTSAMSGSLPVAIRSGLVPAFFGGGLPVLAAVLRGQA